MNAYYERYKSRLAIIGIGIANSDAELEAHCRINGLKFNIIYDTGNILQALKMTGDHIPSIYLLVNDENRIVSVNLFNQLQPEDTERFLARTNNWLSLEN